MATPQQRRLEEERKRQQAQRSKPTNKPPAVGSKRADGKIYSGQNYGYQSPASNRQLKDQGKLKIGAQALDRAAQSIGRAIPKPVKQFAADYQARGQRIAEQQRQQDNKTAVGRKLNEIKSKPNATERVLKGVSDKTNVDQRIVNAGAAVAQAAISKKALGGAKPTQVRGASTPVRGAVAPQPRSVGAAGRPPVNPAKPQPGARLGGPNQKLEFSRVYHGTSEFAGRKIREGGYVESPGGVFGKAVYTGNRKMAQQYADAAGRRLGDNGRVLAHRVPKKNQTTVPFQKPEARQRVSPQTEQVQQRLRQGQTTRVDYGKGSHVTPLTKQQADKTLVKPNGQLRVSRGQATRLKTPRGQKARLNIDNVQASEGKYFKPGRRTVNTETAARNIEAQLKGLKKGSGFTVDPRTGRVPTRGSQVAIDGRVLRDTSPEGIRRFVERNKGALSRPDVKVGGWVSDRSGKPVIELSRRVRNPKEAVRLGKKFQQEGVYHNRGEYQGTGGRDQLRFTRGNATAGGSRIGGQRQTLKAGAPKGTLKKPSRVTTSKTQGTQLVNRDGSKRQLPTRIRETAPQPPKSRPNGQRNFTPARRAEANLRRAVNPKNMLKVRDAGLDSEVRTSVSPGTNKFVSTYRIPGARNGRGKVTYNRHDLSFDYVLKPNGTPYGQRREIGKPKASKVKDARDRATTKALIGEHINREVKDGDKLVASPTTRGRERLYRSASKGALKSHNGKISVTRNGNRWQDNLTNQWAGWDPGKMKEELKKLASSKAGLVGRRAGGTSKLTAKGVTAKSGPKPKYNKPDNITQLKKALAKATKLFPNGRKAIYQPWPNPPYIQSAVHAQGPHRGFQRSLGERESLQDIAYTRELLRRGYARNEFPGRDVADQLLEVAAREVRARFGPPRPERDWLRVAARQQRIRANGGVDPVRPNRSATHRRRANRINEVYRRRERRRIANNYYDDAGDD